MLKSILNFFKSVCVDHFNHDDIAERRSRYASEVKNETAKHVYDEVIDAVVIAPASAPSASAEQKAEEPDDSSPAASAPDHVPERSGEGAAVSGNVASKEPLVEPDEEGQSLSDVQSAGGNVSSPDREDAGAVASRADEIVLVADGSEDPLDESQPSGYANVETEEVIMPEDNGADKLKIYHLILLDESGSMWSFREQTVSGCNSALQTIRLMQRENPDQQHYVSLFFFSRGHNGYYVRNVMVNRVMDVSLKDYNPNSATPLYDAMGYTLTGMLTQLEPANTLGYVTIITDGYENASREYDLGMVRELIDRLKAKDVIFSLVGANINAYQYAQSFDISNAMQFEQTDEGVDSMWERENRSRMRSSAQMRFKNRYMNESNPDDFAAEGNNGHYYDEVAGAHGVSPERITHLDEGEIFVFGSRADGSHSGGAAAQAVAHFGARAGQAEGLQGQSYAIVTDGVSEEEMFHSIERFCDFAAAHPELTFLVTKVGCGTAGYSPYVVGPMFRKAFRLNNVKLPKAFLIYSSF